MVNILIHQFQPDGGVVDEAALEQFQKQWATYQKVVDADGLSHKAVGKILHDTLNQTFAADAPRRREPRPVPGAFPARQSTGMDHANR
jgi:hypothetical protein